MNKIFTLLLCVLAIGKVNGQSSIGIKSTSTWKIDKVVNVISREESRCSGDESYTMFVSGDTTINSVKYFKIYKTGILYLSTPVAYSDKYCGAVRENGSKVYYIENSKSADELLYDYGLKVGDTIKGRVAKDTKILDIDTLSDGRKRFHLSKDMLHGMDPTIIEGIGSFGGLLNDPPVGHYMWNDSYLVCYKENDQVIFSGIDYFEKGCDSKVSRFPINPKATWNVDYVLNDEPEKINDGDEIFRYHIINDTTINNQKYYKLYKSGMAFYGTYFYYNNVYLGALRDDNNKFFYVGKNKFSEELLYDFDLKVGDTIKATLGKGLTIKKIETLPDGRRKLLCLGTCLGCPIYEFIEGIGHWGGIMEDAPRVHRGFREYYLLCYKVDNELIYSNNFDGLFKKGCETLSVPDIHKGAIRLFPQPVNNILTVEVEGLKYNDAQVAILDINGREVLVQNITLKAKKATVNVSRLNKGYYLVKIISNNALVTQKMIKN